MSESEEKKGGAAQKVKTCRVCGCTDDKACMSSQGPCWWVADDLCSACVVKANSKEGMK